VATSLNNLAYLLQGQGEYARAQDYYQQALAMKERIYPKAKYPRGHPNASVTSFAVCRTNVASLRATLSSMSRGTLEIKSLMKAQTER
jgi:hypothetical protein